MSQNKKNANFGFIDLVKNSAVLVVFSIPVFLIVGFVLSYALLNTGTPESFYGFAKYLLLIIPSFVIGKVVYKKYKSDRFLYTLAYSLLATFLLVIVSLFLNLDGFDFLQALINFLVVYISAIVGSLSSNNKKKKSHLRKRK